MMMMIMIAAADWHSDYPHTSNMFARRAAHGSTSLLGMHWQLYVIDH